MMQHLTKVAVSRGRLVRILVCVLVIAVCALISSGVWAQSDRKERKGSGKATEKREPQARKNDSGSRETSTKRSSVSKTEKKSGGSAGEKRTSGSRVSRDTSRTSSDRATSRLSDKSDRSGKSGRSDKSDRSGKSGRSGDRRGDGARTIEREGDGTSTHERLEDRADDRTSRERKPVIYDRYRRTKRRDDGDRERAGKKKKKDNPGYGKKITKPGENKRIRIDPRPGRHPPPPPPDVDIIIWDPWGPPPPLVPRLPWRPHPGPGYIDGEEYVIHLPAGIIEPDEIEQDFIEKIDYIRSIGRGDSLIVCLYQTRDPITDEEVSYLFDRGVTFYRFLSSYTAIIDVSVEDIFLLVMDMPNFRWIGQYRAEYKYRHEPPVSDRRGAYVHSLAGDSNEFRNVLNHLGIRVVTYYEDAEDYYVIADWEQFHEIAGLWWVEKVHKESETFSRVYGFD